MTTPRVITPPQVPYGGSYTAKKSALCIPPKEGPFVVPASINWIDYFVSASNQCCVYFNLQNTNVGTNPITQIACLFIDNSTCLFSTTFVFPSTGCRITAPALSSGYFPVITSDLQFVGILNAAGGAPGRITNLEIMNFSIPQGNVSENVAGIMQIIDSSGTIQYFGVGDITTTTLVAATSAAVTLILNQPSSVITDMLLVSDGIINLSAAPVEWKITDPNTIGVVAQGSIPGFDGTNYNVRSKIEWHQNNMQYKVFSNSMPRFEWIAPNNNLRGTMVISCKWSQQFET